MITLQAVLAIAVMPHASLQKMNVNSDGTFEVLQLALYGKHGLSRIGRFFRQAIAGNVREIVAEVGAYSEMGEKVDFDATAIIERKSFVHARQVSESIDLWIGCPSSGFIAQLVRSHADTCGYERH